MKKLRELSWKIFGRPDLPPRDFIIFNKFETRGDKMARMWLQGYTLEKIAENFNCTRERVRQCCWKAYRKYS